MEMRNTRGTKTEPCSKRSSVSSWGLSYKDFQRKFFNSDWLTNLSSQSECLKISIAKNLRCKMSIGPGPGYRAWTVPMQNLKHLINENNPAFNAEKVPIL